MAKNRESVTLKKIGNGTAWKEDPFQVDLPDCANTGFNIVALPAYEQDDDGDYLVDGLVSAQVFDISSIPQMLASQGLEMRELNTRIYFSVPRSHKWFEIINTRSGSIFVDESYIPLCIEGVQWRSWKFAPSGIYSDEAVKAIQSRD